MLITQCNIMASPVREAVESKISFLFVFFSFLFFFCVFGRVTTRGLKRRRNREANLWSRPRQPTMVTKTNNKAHLGLKCLDHAMIFFPLLFQVVFLLYESINKHWESSKMKRIRSIKWICYLDTHRDVCWDMTDIDLSVEITKLMRARHCNIYH